MAVKFSRASVAVCSSILSSWQRVSKLFRTELSSILPHSNSGDSSLRICPCQSKTSTPIIKNTRVAPPKLTKGTPTTGQLRWLPDPRQHRLRVSHASANNSHNAANWRENSRPQPNKRERLGGAVQGALWNLRMLTQHVISFATFR